MSPRLPRLPALRGEARGVAAVFALLWLTTTIWFFASRDDQGRTARLRADAWYYHAYAPSLVLDADLDFSNQYEISGNWYDFGQTSEGRPGNVFGIGPAIFAMPLYLVGHAAARVAGIEADGFSGPEVELSLYSSLLFSLAALWFSYRLCRRRLARAGPALTAVLLLFAGGPAIYYAVRQPGYAHPFAAFWVAWLIDHWDASFDAGRPRSRRHWLGFGALLGAAMLARPQLVLWAITAAVSAADDLRWLRRSGATGRDVARQVGRWALAAAVALVLFAPQLLAWNSIYGQLLVVPQGDGFMRWDQPAWSETLFSSRNGLFPWAPIYAVAAVGTLVSVRRWPRLCAVGIAGILLQAVANGAAWDWWAGGSFGGRRFDSCAAIFALGLGAVVLALWPWRAGPPLLRAARGGALAFLGAVAVANVQHAGYTTAANARMEGGEPAADVIARRAAGPLGHIAGAASRWANAPARLAYAWYHDVPLDTYDSVVGTHRLGELFPGLNALPDVRSARVPLAPGHPAVLDLHPAEGEGALLGDRPGRVLIGLNRRGPIYIDLRIHAREAGTVRLSWNGELAVTRDLAGGQDESLRAEVASVVRGTNVLSIEGPAGTRLEALWLRTPVAPDGAP